MPKSLAQTLRHDVEAALDDVAKSLKAAAEDLSGDAQDAVHKAAKDVTHAAEALRKQAETKAKALAQTAAHEVQEHPLATLAAAITAAAALVGVIAAARHKDE